MNKLCRAFVLLTMTLTTTPKASSAIKDFEQALQKAFTAWQIPHPINLEYSVKMKQNGACTADRIAVQIPQAYLHHGATQLIDICKHLQVPPSLRRWLVDNTTNGYYAVLIGLEESDTARWKVYVDYGLTTNQLKIDSCELNGKQLCTREYIKIQQQSIPELPSSWAQQLYGELHELFDNSSTLYKKTPTADSFCFGFKPGTTLNDLIKRTTLLQPALYCITSRFQQPIDLSWVLINDQECTVYFRLHAWYLPQAARVS